MFHTQEISLLNILNLEAMSSVTINPNDSIQTAIDNASAGDTIFLNGGTYNQHDINVTKENLTIKASGIGGVPIIDGQGQGRGFNVGSSSGVLIQDLTITNTKATGISDGIYMNGANCSVSGCSFTNTSSNGNGGGIYINSGSVSGCSFTNTRSIYGSGGGVYVAGSGCSVVFNRFVNNTDNGAMVNNGVYGYCNVSSNWWGNNTPQSITDCVMMIFISFSCLLEMFQLLMRLKIILEPFQ